MIVVGSNQTVQTGSMVERASVPGRAFAVVASAEVAS